MAIEVIIPNASHRASEVSAVAAHVAPRSRWSDVDPGEGTNGMFCPEIK